MADDDEVGEEFPFDPTFATAGPRRSTFTPPTGSIPAQQESANRHDDDALADALAADLSRLAPGTVPPRDATGIPAAPVAEPEPAPPAPEQQSPYAPPAYSPPTPPAYAPPVSAPPPSTAPTWAAPAPWSAFPAPDPAQAVQLPNPTDQQFPTAPPASPSREQSATLDLIEQLQARLEQRDREARGEAYQGPTATPFVPPPATPVMPPGPAAPPTAPISFVDPEGPVTAWPFPRSEGESPAPPLPYNEHPPAPEPSVRQFDYGTTHDVPVADGPPSPAPGDTPAWQQPIAYEVPPFGTPAVDLPPPAGAPAAQAEPEVVQPPLPAWEVPAPGPNWAPGPEYDPDAEAEAEPAPPAPAPTGTVPSWQPDLESLVPSWGQAPEPGPGSDPAPAGLPAAQDPPPLIEPTRHGPPLLPSQTGSLPRLGPLPPVVPAPPAADAPEGPAVGAEAPDRAFSFDDLLSGPAHGPAEPDEEPPLHRDPEPASAAGATPETIFIEPMSVAAGEAPPTDTGSITIVDQAYDEELPDDVDETDRVFAGLGPVSVDTSGIAVVTGAIVHPPSGPISTVRIPEDEVVLIDNEPVKMRVFSLEDSGLDATPVDHRVGRSARLFWLWFAANSSILSLGLGATVFAVGMSLRQSIVSILAGVALSFIPLGLTTLAGKRSGQPTMVVSRATFGLLGNVIPAILALVTRLFWGAVLLWLLASSVTIVLVGAKLDGSIGERQLLLISLAVAFLVALLVAVAGYPLFARIQLILSVISAILVVGLIAMTWRYVDVSRALTTPDGPWLLTVGGAVLVFSVVGLVWANSGADLARYQRPATSGAASMLWATVGTTLPTFLLIGYGALLAASDPGIASGFLGSPLDTLARMLPVWYPVPLLAATGLSLLSGIILTLYSAGFALQAVGLRARRQWSTVIVAVLLAGLALLITFGVTGGMTELFRDAATTLAVPTAAWAGIFAAETMIRNRRFDSPSLLVRGGVYADVRWLNLIALVLISVVGYGLTTATVTWLGWQGYGFTLLGMPLDSDLATSDVGVLAALVLGLLVPLVAGVPAIRRQEALRG